jgi:hypothetical protein
MRLNGHALQSQVCSATIVPNHLSFLNGRSGLLRLRH